jgi:RNA processing factor Prp31
MSNEAASQRLSYLVLTRFKLKFSPDKVDTMVIQAIALLDDLDKEINIYSMRVKVPPVPLLVPSLD